jgi:hypothetical protein
MLTRVIVNLYFNTNRSWKPSIIFVPYSLMRITYCKQQRGEANFKMINFHSLLVRKSVIPKSLYFQNLYPALHIFFFKKPFTLNMPLNQLMYSSFNFNCKEWKAFVYPHYKEYFIICILSLLILTLSREHLHILSALFVNSGYFIFQWIIATIRATKLF